MARLVAKLTQLTINKLTAPGYYGDGAGLWLQVSPTGSKSWIFRYTIQRKQREMGLGSLLTLTLAEARVRAKQCRQMLLDGHDPIGVRKASKLADAIERAKAMTFDQCAKAYITAHRAGWKNEKHIGQWENTLATYASPIIGALPVAEVDTALIVKVLTQAEDSNPPQPLWERKTETATRLRGRIEKILDWATVGKFRTGENPARWRGHLDNLLANPNKIAKVTHHPALPWAEAGAFMVVLRQQAGTAARALEFAILTAARSGEVRGATWDEIDLDAALWVIPAERMKMKKEHRVPLSKSAVALLKNLPREQALVFPGATPTKQLSDMSLTAVLRRMKRDDITVHGFRSTFRDWCAESTNFPREVCEHALAHSLPDKVEAAYRRGDLIEKRVLLMQAWDDYCAKPVTPATATPINRQRTA